MKVQVSCLAVLALSLLDVIVQAADTPDSVVGTLDKRRGWGKRDSGLDASLEEEKRLSDALEAEEEVDKRRGWGKRDPIDALEEMDKRRGWGKRSDNEDMEKRRGWGKRSDGETEMDKRRGWGKRSDLDMDKRRGWGKRSYPEDALENDMDKRRGWGKRSAVENAVLEELEKRRGWGKRSLDKRRGWGKRSNRIENETCEQLRNEVFVYVYKAVEAEARRINQCEGNSPKV